MKKIPDNGFDLGFVSLVIVLMSLAFAACYLAIGKLPW